MKAAASLVVVLALAGCQILGLQPAPCAVDGDCPIDERCVQRQCAMTSPPVDAGTRDGGSLIIDDDAGSTVVAIDAAYTVADGEPFAFTLAATAAVGAQLTFNVVDATDHGLLATDGPDVVYTPTDGYDGADALTFEASAAGGGTSTGTITFAVKHWWDPAYRGRVRVDLDAAGGAADVVDVPILIAVPQSIASQAVNGDLRVVADDQQTALAVEVLPATTSGARPLWVKIPALAAATTTRVWIYLGDPTPGAAPAASAVWTSGYRGVWHFDGNLADATTGAHAAEDSGAPNGTQSVAGQVGDARFCDGTSSHLELGNHSDFVLRGDLTLSAWVNFEDFDAVDFSNPLFSMGGPASTFDQNYLYYFWIDELGRPGFFSQDPDDNDARATAMVQNLAGRWAWLAVTRDDQGTLTFYVDGARLGVAVSTPLPTDGTLSELWICGDSFDAQNRLHGAIDEAHIAAAVRSPEFLAAQFASMTGALESMGALEVLSE